ncbi:MAG: serine/threonine protein kinase [Pirellula sp.]|nr:serine/threonine protein kinase [Pirellula sp.]
MAESVFKNSVIASGLVAKDQWDYCLRLLRHRQQSAAAKQESTSEDQILKDILLEQGAITEYQALQLADGKTKFRLGPYVITDFIGQGGMGQVFKAVHQVMGRECAVKVLPLHRVNPESLSGFIREIRMQAKLDCPYLVRAHDAGQDGSVHYLVTEYVAGMDLRKLVKSQGPLNQDQAAGILMQAALGLSYAHEQGMVHRDVKPGNILVTPESMAKVSDVGLAGFAADLSDDPRAGKIVGTPDYLSPEQIQTPLSVAPVSDVYSLGCTLYYAVTGKAPFPGGDTASKIRRHLEATPLHPRNFNSGLSEEFVEIIAEMMEKDPTKRIQTCAEVAARLEVWATTSMPLAQSTITRGPWLAPPPPVVDPLPMSPLTGEALSLTSRSSVDTGAVRSPAVATWDGVSQTNASEPEGVVPPPPYLEATARENHQVSRGMLVALTVAILLPPALLLGAILGYMIGLRT